MKKAAKNKSPKDFTWYFIIKYIKIGIFTIQKHKFRINKKLNINQIYKQ